MATKNLFGGLLKITGAQWEAYNDAKVPGNGKIIFANITGESDDEHNGKYIWANGVEYKIADDSAFKQLVERVEALEAWKPDVDVSIDRLDSSVSTLEALLADYSEWKASVDSSINELQAKDIEIDASISDISTRLSNALVDASISAAVADNSTLITLKTINDADTVSTTSVKVSGSKYVNVVEDGKNNVKLTVTTASVADATVSGEGLADAKDVKDYVSDVLKDLEQALIFKGPVDESSDLPVDASAGWTYVATDNFDILAAQSIKGVDTSVETGDLLIANDKKQWIVVERNLDGAVTAGSVLDSSNLVVGTGNQGIKTIDITVDDLTTAIANANSAIQGVNAAATQNTYVRISVDTSAQNTSVKDVSAVLSVVDTSVALSTVTATGSLVDAVAVKEFVEGKIEEIPEVEMTLDSSTPEYVTTSATVSDGVINASIGVITATLADASNGSIGLAMAKDVYDELTAVEETAATAITDIQKTLGLNDDLTVSWSAASGIPADSTYKDAIEDAYQAAHSDDLSTYVHQVVDTSIDELQVKDVEIDASINRLDASVSTLEDKLDEFEVKSIEGETGIAERANDEYVAVSVSEPDTDGKVTIDSSVQLAVDVSVASHETATGLATDGWVKDFLAWEVIGDNDQA